MMIEAGGEIGSVAAPEASTKSHGVEPSRIPSLDGLRAGAIGLVLVGHLAGTRGCPVQRFFLLAFYAEAGVRAFFVLSGFLITTLLLRERQASGTIRLKEFYIRRAYRILPAAYFYMFVMIAIYHTEFAGRDIAIALSYLTCYSLHRPWVLGHLWSLSVEEQFYLLWPVVMKTGEKLAKRLAVGIIVVAPVARVILRATGHTSANGSYFPVVADSIAVGCLLALFQPWVKKHAAFFAWRGFPLIWAVTLAVPLLNEHSKPFRLVGGCVLYFGLALCMQNAMVAKYRILNASLPVWIGTLSYSLYLWQQPFLNRYSTAWYAAFPVNIVLAFVAAGLSYYCIERPGLRLREQRRQRAREDERGLAAV